MQFLWPNNYTKLMRCSVQWFTVFNVVTDRPHPAPECRKEREEHWDTARRPAERDWELRVETGVATGWRRLSVVRGCGGGWSQAPAGAGREPGNTPSWALPVVSIPVEWPPPTTHPGHHPHPPPSRLCTLIVFSSFDINVITIHNILRRCPLAPFPLIKRPLALESGTIKN